MVIEWGDDRGVAAPASSEKHAFDDLPDDLKDELVSIYQRQQDERALMWSAS